MDDFRERVILETSPSQNKNPIRKDPDKRNKLVLRTIKYTNDEILIEVSSNGGGFVVISDNYHPGWYAYVDGVETKILRANYIMKAIPVTSGNHIIKLYFKPKMLIAGWWITISGWIIFIGFAAIYALNGISKKYFHKIIK